MPKLSMGFWFCDYCNRRFDRSDHASRHEALECPHRMSGDLVEGRAAFRPSPVGAFRPRAETPPPPPPYTMGAKRRAPLIGTTGAVHLSQEDMEACRLTEFFEIMGYERDVAARNVPSGPVGVRCLYCGDRSGNSAVAFPRGVHDVGHCVDRIARHHLMRCTQLPVDIRRRLESYGFPESQRGDINALRNHGIERCQDLGIINRQPPNSGVVFQQMDVRHMEPQPSPRQAGGSFGQRQSFGGGYSMQQQPAFAGAAQPVYSSYAAAYEEVPAANVGIDPRQARRGSVPGPGQPAGAARYEQYSNFPIPTDFAFFQEPSGDWICKYCATLPPQYRDENHCQWRATDGSPPPFSFVNFHLSNCQEYARVTGGFQPASFNPASAQPQPQYAYEPQPTNPMPYGHSVAAWEAQPAVPQGSRGSLHHQYATTPTRTAAPVGYAIAPDEYEPVPTQPSSSRGNEDVDAKTRELIAFLEDRSMVDSKGNRLPEDLMLVVQDDKLLLTDYFFYLMKQLQLVRFSEADRRTRGGKRESIAVGYGGLQCVHCATASNSRKFFWSNVDRLANSFAEIPSHVLKCRRCPQDVKDALLYLKGFHSEQMARLPRGSQKIFFRRMWRRVHEGDPASSPEKPRTPKASPTATGAAELEQQVEKPEDLDVKPAASKEESPSGTISSSDSSTVRLERSTEEAAKALADSARQTSPPEKPSRVLLAIHEDSQWLSDTDCFVRRQIEVFCASAADVKTAAEDRKWPILEGQVGIRCLHCAKANKDFVRGHAVAYPYTVNAIYECVREFQRAHLESCDNLPRSVKGRLAEAKGSASLSSVLRKYYIQAAMALGLRDTKEGIRAGAEAKPISAQAAFASPEGNVRSGEAHAGPEVASPSTPIRSSDSRKRPPEEHQSPPRQSPQSKKGGRVLEGTPKM